MTRLPPLRAAAPRSPFDAVWEAARGALPLLVLVALAAGACPGGSEEEASASGAGAAERVHRSDPVRGLLAEERTRPPSRGAEPGEPR